MMSRWTHSICDPCWDRERRETWGDPTRIVRSHRKKEICCFCRRENQDGIYVREDPKSDKVLCGGDHPEKDRS
jgi:hypothetical protein